MQNNKLIVTPAEYRAMMRNDFPAFIQRSFRQLNAETEFLPNWHIEAMAAKLEACRRGTTRRLIINVPPRSLKSLCASVAFPAWILGHHPSAQIMCVSYAQDLADKLARDCRAVVSADWYQKLFRTQISREKQSVGEFVTTAGGYRLATSVGGVITGRGADFIIIDDPLKPADALSESLRKAANDWYDNTLYSRLNDKRTGCIIVIMQRLHQDDLVGHLLERDERDVLSLPAIAEEDEKYLIETPYGPKKIVRLAGEALHAEREPLSVLKGIRKSMSEYDFASQYQQSPAPLGGGLVKADWFKSYAEKDLPEHFGQVIQSWDTANKATELADYSVCTTLGIKDKRIYILNVFRKKVNYPELKRAVREQAEMYKATLVLIEDKASGTQLIQELVKEGLHIVKPVKPEGDKTMRFNAQTATIENGFVYLPEATHWLADFIYEITTFPAAKYDDQADSISQALAWITLTPAEDGLIAFYRHDTARMMHAQGHSNEAIAEAVDASPDEIKTWIEESKRRELEQEAKRIGVPRCGGCKDPIPFGTPWQLDGGKKYHPACWRKKVYGC